MPLITVLIDTYNYGRFIEDAVESVLKQDFPMEQVEILVVDDGSTDDTAERVKKYGSRIRYLYKRNGGQASAFNFGFANAKGEIVALLDADDYFLPGKLRRISEEFQAHPETGMIYHRPLNLQTESGDMSEADFSAISGHAGVNKLHDLLKCQTSCLAFRRTVLASLMPIPEKIRLLADTYLVFLAALSAPVLALSEPLAVYRIHGRNLFYSEAVDPPSQTRMRHLGMTIRIFKAVRLRMKDNRFSSPVWTRSLMERQILDLERLSFTVEPPGRFRFFLFLLRENYIYRTQQTWRFTTYNYLTAFVALFWGDKNADWMYEWRRKNIGLMRAMLPRFLRRSDGDSHTI